MIWQIKEFGKEVFLSFSDELKIKILRQQFAYVEQQHDEIKTWLRANANEPYFFELITDHYWVRFVDETDAAAFKLRWS